ncbi:hypothetical protein ACWIGW_40075 [Nocardia brasiliensis]
MTRPSGTSAPNISTPQSITRRRRIVDMTAGSTATAAFVLDLTGHEHIAMAARAISVALRILNTVLDRRAADCGSVPA